MCTNYLIVVFLNVGYFYKKSTNDSFASPEFYTIPKDIIAKYHKIGASGWQKVETRKIEGLENYKNEKGFELIAEELGVLKLNRNNYQPKETGKKAPAANKSHNVENPSRVRKS